LIGDASRLAEDAPAFAKPMVPERSTRSTISWTDPPKAAATFSARALQVPVLVT
jgi:hypothetical protein